MITKPIHKRQLSGLITSHAMNKTAVVSVIRVALDAKYQKRYRTSKKFKVHDEKNEFKKGDLVVIEECKPISKEKKWRIIKKLNQLN